MSLPSLARPVLRSTTCARPSFVRGHKTTARTKRALKIAPHPSFLPDRTSQPSGNHIIYNPPSSAASPYYTPHIFLPPGDPRLASPVKPAPTTETADLPPEMKYKRRDPNPTYKLTAADVAEMRSLRNEDPLTWSVNKLAEKFGCSEIFVQMAAPAPKGHLRWLRQKMDRKKERWGPKKTQAREERRERTEMLYRGEI